MANILCLITNSMSHNKKVIITGASKGIGEAICMRLLKQNYSVVAICRSAPNIPGVEHMACDLSDRTERSTAFKSLACHGPIYGLVNNAGVNDKLIDNANVIATDAPIPTLRNISIGKNIKPRKQHINVPPDTNIV